MKEKINSYNNFKPLFLQCESCHKKHHHFAECPLITYNPKSNFIFQNIIASNPHIERRVFQRKPRKIFLCALNDQKYIENQMLEFQDKYKDEIDKVIEEMSPSDDGSDYNFNESMGTGEHKSSESKDSQYTYNKDQVNSTSNYKTASVIPEEFFGSPPSIFLQTPQKNRKSVTESIFHEDDEEDMEDRSSKMPISKNTYNDFELENENENYPQEYYEEEDDSEEEDESEKKTSKNASMICTDKKEKLEKGSKTLTSLLHQNTNFSQKEKGGFRSIQRIFTERDSKIISEKDTYHMLQNLDKMNRIASMTAGSVKKSMGTSVIGSHSMSKSNSSSYPRGRTLMIKSSSNTSSQGNSNMNAFFSSKNRKIQFKEYLKHPLFAFDFDKPKEFKSFMPHNNMGKVVKTAQIDEILRGDFHKFRFEVKKTKRSFTTSNAANTSLSAKKMSEKDDNETLS